MDGFLTRLVPVQKYEFNDGNCGQDFFGVYATRKVLDPSADLDLYWLGLDRDMATFGGSSEIGQEIDLTLRWQIDPHASVLLGCSDFFPGEFIELTGPADRISFAYASFEFKL